MAQREQSDLQERVGLRCAASAFLPSEPEQGDRNLRSQSMSAPSPFPWCHAQHPV